MLCLPETLHHVDVGTLHLSISLLKHASLVMLAALAFLEPCHVTAVVVISDKLPASDLLHHQCNTQQDRPQQFPASPQAPDLLSARARVLVRPYCVMDAGMRHHALFQLRHFAFVYVLCLPHLCCLNR